MLSIARLQFIYLPRGCVVEAELQFGCLVRLAIDRQEGQHLVGVGCLVGIDVCHSHYFLIRTKHCQDVVDIICHHTVNICSCHDVHHQVPCLQVFAHCPCRLLS